ncbi:MAG TPA: bifunctional oligoribonuclease/PAP phosphatase NrnA [Actinomycetota bacterium]
MSDELAHAARVLREAREVALACHVNPDPDALGSMLGLSSHLRAQGVRTVCSFGNDPFEAPRWLERLPGREALVPPGDFPEAPEVMVTCDTASMDRLGVLGAAAGTATELIWIDHHASNDGLGTIPLVDRTASSTCELVFRLVREIGGEMPDQVAVCLYAGLITDTGRFQYTATRPETLRIAAELREHPFDHAALAQALYEDNGAAYLRLLGTVLRRLRLEPEADLVWTYLTRADLAEAGVEPAETDDLIDVIRTAREADVAAVVKQQRDGRFKVSLRSRGGHDVAGVASRFGGGGHRLAAGYTSRHGLALTLRELQDALGDGSSRP